MAQTHESPLQHQTTVGGSRYLQSSTLAILVLALASFAIGTTEFLPLGLLPNIATDMQVSLSTAGLLVSGYAFGVFIGSPLLTMTTTRLPRKTLLLLLMGLFILGNLLCTITPNFVFFIIARIVTALCHGTFFGASAIMATTLVRPERATRAIALVFAGATIANVLGVPLGTFLGQYTSWRIAFLVISLLGLLVLLGMLLLLPQGKQAPPLDVRAQIRVVMHRSVLLALLPSVLGYWGILALFTYIAPLAEQLAGFAPSALTYITLLFGGGMVLGNALGGRLADKRLMSTIIGAFVLLILVLASFSISIYNQAAFLVGVFLLGLAAIALVPSIQMHVLKKASAAPELASTLNIAAFNLANAVGAFLGGLVIASPLGLHALAWVGALSSLIGLGLVLFSILLERRWA